MAAYFCPHCKVNATFKNLGPNHQWSESSHTIWICHNCGGVVYAMVRTEPHDLDIFPTVRDSASDDYPPAVREDFGEALRSMNGGNPKSAVVMTRGALQAAMREHEARGDNLKQEIEDLAERHIIPGALKDWAHELRDGGNLVAHPKPGQKVKLQDAEELIALAESVFEYLYVIPADVERRRQRLQPEQADNTSKESSS